MINTARSRYIHLAIACYIVLALAWILTSDQLLAMFVDLRSIVWLSMAKGIFFILASSIVFYFILRAVPAREGEGGERTMDALMASIATEPLPRWLMYVAAVAITVSMLAVRALMGFGERPLLILFIFPVILSAMLGGLGPGLLSTVVAAFASLYFLGALKSVMTLIPSYDLLQWGFLIVNGVAVSLLSEMLKKSLARVEVNRSLLDSVISGTPDVVFIKDRQGRYLLANQAALNFSRKKAAEVLGHGDSELFPDSTARQLWLKDREIMAGGVAQTYEEELNTFDGRHLVFQISKGPIFDRQRQVVGLFGVARDISEHKLAEEKLRQAATVFESTRDGVMITGLDDRILAVNKAFIDITGYAEQEVLGKNAAIQRSGRHGPEFYQTIQASLQSSGQWQGEIWKRRKTGEVYPAWMTVSTVRDEDQHATQYISVFSDISQLKRSQEELSRLAHYDPLTGLPNRLLVQSRLEHALSRAERHGSRVAVLFIDLDHFKTVNDSLGHVAGDQLLVDVAQRLGLRVRQEDTLGRFGGDEFLLLLEPLDDPEEAALVARDALAALHAPFPLMGDNEVFIGASIGISIYPDDGASAAELLRDADAAMYQAKGNGRNRFCFYTSDMNRNAMAQLELEVALRRALERQEFVLYYQPKVDLRTGQISGAEALIRWQRSGDQLELPASFIPLAEKTGLIAEIGAWVIDSACRQLRLWRDAGWVDLCLAVNVSGRQFHTQDLVSVVTLALQRHAVPAANLELELTESMLMESPEQTVATLRKLKDIGIKVALDDFGTGYSSFAYLSRFPLDTLKIDQSFVRHIVTEPESAMIAVSIIDLAHRLHLNVVAEGVETEAQLGYLKMRGCDDMQGYYFARPMAGQDFFAMLCAGTCLPLAADAVSTASRTILLVDDEPNVLASLQRVFARDRYRILTAASGQRGLELLATHAVQVILSDQRMPNMSGTDFLSRAKELYPETVRIVLSGYSDIDSITRAVNEGAIYKFLHKPWDNELLREHIRDAFVYQEAVVKSRNAKAA